MVDIISTSAQQASSTLEMKMQLNQTQHKLKQVSFETAMKREIDQCFVIIVCLHSMFSIYDHTRITM